MKTVLKAGLATAAYGVLHSLLAARRTKDAAARWLGYRHRAGLYRPFYIGQSLLTFGVLAIYIRGLPRDTLYEVSGPRATLMRAGQGAALAWAVFAAGSVGFGNITGLRNMGRWMVGKHTEAEPEAQGPAPEDGEMRVTGPFRYSRHPLNFAPLPVMWLQPTLTTRLLGFNLVGTAYLLLGSVHEEKRLEERYGKAYRRYLDGGVPFYLPRPSSQLRVR